MAAASGPRVGSRGQNTALPYVGSRSFGTDLGSRPTPVTQTIGMMSNQTIPYHFTIARWAGDLEKNIMNGQLVFLQCGKKTPLIRNRAFTMLNLQMCNYALYREELARKQADQINTATTSRAEVLSEILTTYRPMGSVINDVNGKYDPSNNSDRVVNVCVSGRQTTFNIWGNIHDHDILYLKLEMREVKGTDFNLSITHHSLVQNDLETTTCYQWVPSSSSDMAVSWKTDQPNNRINPVHCVEIGRVFRCPRGKHMDWTSDDRLHYSQHLSDCVSKTHMIEVHFDFKG